MNYEKSELETNPGEGTFNREGVFGGESDETISREEKEENTIENEDDDLDEEDNDTENDESGKSTGKTAPKDNPTESF